MRTAHHRGAHLGATATGPARPNGRRSERGVVLIIVALSLTVLTTSVAFAVDLGRLSSEARQEQATADAAALDVARVLDGRTAAELVADPAWSTELDASLARNGFTQDGAHHATAALGTWDEATATFTPATGADVPDAVQVTLVGHVTFDFAPGGRDVTRTSTATEGPALVA